MTFPFAHMPVGVLDPASIPDLELWFDASDAATTVISSGIALSQWGEKSHGRHATQPTGAIQPTLQIGALNGRNAVGFADALGQMFTFPAVNLNPAGYTWFGVFYKGTNLFECFGQSTVPFNTIPEFTHAGFYFFDSQSSEVVNVNGVPSDGIWQQCSAVITGVAATSELFSNGVPIPLEQNAALASPITFIDQLGAGDSTTCQGMMAEILFYNRLLAASERLRIEAYLKPKWGTP